MDKQFTASEVHRLSNRIPRSNDEIADAQEALRAFADLLEAREKAVPVAYAEFANNGCVRMWSRGYEERLPGTRMVPLYTHPAPSDAERLAEALRATIAEIQGLRDAMFRVYATAANGRDPTDAIEAMRSEMDKPWSVDNARAALAAHSAQAQPPAASATKRERKGHTEWLQGSEKDGGGTTNYVEPVWVWDEPEQTAASVTDGFVFERVNMGRGNERYVGLADGSEGTTVQEDGDGPGDTRSRLLWRIADAALAAQENPNGV